MPIPEEYSSFHILKKYEKEGEDFAINFRTAGSGILIMAPHGGNIEPGTTEIAEKIAGREHSYYSFEGLKPKGNWRLHIPSTHFDEPLGLEMAAALPNLIAIHGCKEKDEIVFAGGLNEVLKEQIERALNVAGFCLGMRDGVLGKSPDNICNKSAQRMGVQLELAFGVRVKMFRDLTGDGRKASTQTFDRFVSAIRGALAEFLIRMERKG